MDINFNKWWKLLKTKILSLWKYVSIGVASGPLLEILFLLAVMVVLSMAEEIIKHHLK